MSDITKRKRDAEEASRMVTVVRDSNDAIMIKDSEGRITAWNHGAELMYGYSEQEALQMKIWQLVPPNKAEEQKDFIRRLFAGEKITSFETQRLAKDGRLLDVWLTVTKLVDETGKVTGIASTERDITGRRRTEAVLKTSEERFRTAVENLSDVIYDWDIKEKVDWYGDIDGITGYPPGGFPRTIEGWAVTIHPEDKVRVMAALEGHLKGVAPYTIEYRVVRKDGEWRWWSARGTALRDGRGEPYKMIGSITDITERKRAEEELKEHRDHLERLVEERTGELQASKEKLGKVSAYNRSLIEASVDLLVTIGKDGKIADVNTATEIATGLKRYQLVGTNFSDYFTNPKKAKAGYEMVFKDGAVIDYPLVLKKKNGTEMSVLYNAAVYKDENGQIIGVFAAARDITDRKKMEDALQKLQEEQQVILDSIPAWVFYKDKENRFLRVNNAFTKVMGVSRENLEGKSLLDFYPKEQAEAFLRDDLEVMVSERPKINIIEPMETPKGTVWVQTDKIPYRDAHGKIIGIIGFSLDVTERKKAEKVILELNETLRRNNVELEALNRELEVFAYSVSHDLRAPLRTIDGFSLAILEDYSNKLDDQGKDYLKRLRGSSQKMAQLIDDLLKLSRVTRSEMHSDPVDLSGMVRKRSSELQGEQPDRLVEFVISPKVHVIGDKNLLAVVVDNLLGNAWKYTGKHPSARIEFGTTEINGKTAYFFKDDGAGFDMKYKAKLFAPFQRLHTSEDFPGTGIGLATIQRIVRRHGGEAWAEGETEKGATFFFTLK